MQRLTDRDKRLMWARIINAARDVMNLAGDRDIRITVALEDDGEEETDEWD